MTFNMATIDDLPDEEYVINLLSFGNPCKEIFLTTAGRQNGKSFSSAAWTPNPFLVEYAGYFKPETEIDWV